MTEQSIPASGAPDIDAAIDKHDATKPLRIPLENPVTWGGKEYTELTVRPCSGGALRAMPLDMEKMTVGDVMTIAARLAGVPDQVIWELTGNDLRRVVRTASFSMRALLGTGETSS